MVQNRKKHRINSHWINHFSTSEGEWVKWATERMSERRGARKQSKQGGASKWVSGASERASGPVHQSVFLAVLDHSTWIVSPPRLQNLASFLSVSSFGRSWPILPFLVLPKWCRFLPSSWLYCQSTLIPYDWAWNWNKGVITLGLKVLVRCVLWLLLQSVSIDQKLCVHSTL